MSKRKYQRIKILSAESSSDESDSDSNDDRNVHNEKSPGKRKRVAVLKSPKRIKKKGKNSNPSKPSKSNKRIPLKERRRNVISSDDTDSSMKEEGESSPSDTGTGDGEVEDEEENEIESGANESDGPQTESEDGTGTKNSSESDNDGMILEDGGDKLLMGEIDNCWGCGALFVEACPCDQFLALVPLDNICPNLLKDEEIEYDERETLPVVTPSSDKGVQESNSKAISPPKKRKIGSFTSPKKSGALKRKSISPAKPGSSTTTTSPGKSKTSPPTNWQSPKNKRKRVIEPGSESECDSDLDLQKETNAEVVDDEDENNYDMKMLNGEVEDEDQDTSEIEMSVPPPVDTQSSSSETEVERSEGEDEIEPESSIPSQPTVPVDTLNMIPRLSGCAGPIYVEEKLFSKVEFSIELYKLNARSKRIEYPDTDFVEFLKTLETSERRYESPLFIFPMKEDLYNRIVSKLVDSAIQREEIKLSDKEFHLDAVGTLRRAVRALSMYRLRNIEQDKSALDPKLLDLFSGFPTLENHQVKAIQFAVSRHGSCILADEQHMGKRVEALVTCKHYEDDWPFMITCASAKVDSWKKLLTTPASTTEIGLGIEAKRVKVVDSEETCQALIDCSPLKYTAVIITYSLLLSKQMKPLIKSIQQEFQFKILIVDESHRIKHMTTKTSRAMRHLIKRSKRRLFLTSNPSFAVPKELFYQLHCVQRKVFQDYENFADLYCGWDINPQTLKAVVSGSWRHARNLKELKHIMFGTLIYRNFRSDLKERLPRLVREQVFLDSKLDERTKRLLGSVNFKLIRECYDALENGSKKEGGIFKWFRRSGTAKLMEVCKYLDSIDYEENKVVIYAHHKDVIKGIEKLLGHKDVNFVKIEGDYEARRDFSQQFHQSDVRVALLSLRRSTHDINLQCADLVIFAELLWVPDNLFRNENRTFKFDSKTTANRTINIKYLYASECDADDHELYIDPTLWEMLSGKMHVLKELGLLKDDFMDQIRTKHFHGKPSAIIDDLVLSDVDDRDSNDEYSPSESGNEEDISEEYESDGSSSEDLVTSSDSNSDQNNEDDDADREDIEQASNSSILDEKENETQSRESESESSARSENLGDTDTGDDDGNDDEDKDLEGFVQRNSSDSDEDADYEPSKKKRKPKRKAATVIAPIREESEEGTESESDDEEYEENITKATKGFFH